MGKHISVLITFSLHFAKKALKLCMHFPKTTSSDLVFSKTNKLSIYNINKYQTNNFIFYVLNGLSPIFFRDFFPIVEEIHSHNTRYGEKNVLAVLPSSSNVRSQSLRIRGSHSWSDVPTSLKMSINIMTFKRDYKKYLLLNN